MTENAMIATPSLLRLLPDGIRRARTRGAPILVSSTDRVPSIAPIDVFVRGNGLEAGRFYWERPDDRMALVAVGSAQTIAVQGDGRFADASAAWDALLGDAIVDDGSMGLPTAGPILLGGFSFDPTGPRTSLWSGFPAGLLILPRSMLTVAGETCWLTINHVLRPESDTEAELERLNHDLIRLSDRIQRPHGGDGIARSSRHESATPPQDLRSAAGWKDLVADARGAIWRGEAEKIVLARAVRVRDGERLQPDNALRRLRTDLISSHPTGCTIFALANGDRCLLGASPESLVRLQDGTVQVSCLAGTTSRGATDAEDLLLGAALLRSAKDRAEHAVVVRALEEQLSAFCVDLQVPAGPILMRLRNVQHLYTLLAGRLRSPQSVLALVERLHPTPAIGGFPRDAALRFIREREGLDRGWYAGPIGWLNRSGEGEFAVAIRSALLHGDSGTGLATLFAGCGIMGDSDPESEYRESLLKLQSMLSTLAGSPAS